MIFTAFISPGSGEFILIMLVLILLFGAKDAPRIFRRIHDFLDKTQRAAASFRYKIMYSDIQNDSPQKKCYKVEEDYPDEPKEPEDSPPPPPPQGREKA